MTMEYSNSKKEFRKAQKLDPRLPDAYSNLGCAYGMSEESSVRRGHAVHGRTCWTMGIRYPDWLVSTRTEMKTCIVLLSIFIYSYCTYNARNRLHHLDRTVPLRKWQRLKETDLVRPWSCDYVRSFVMLWDTLTCGTHFSIFVVFLHLLGWDYATTTSPTNKEHNNITHKSNQFSQITT